jgi:hypothetical protein
MGGRMSREKGRRFECLVRNLINGVYPDAQVFRTLQADRAHQGDVHVASGPGMLPLLWIECHHGKTAIAAKLAQARGDIVEARRGGAIAVVVWRRTGSPDVNASLGLRDLVTVRMSMGRVGTAIVPAMPGDDDVVTMHFDRFLRLVG